MREYQVTKNTQHNLPHQKLGVVQATPASDRAGLAVRREIQLQQPTVIHGNSARYHHRALSQPSHSQVVVAWYLGFRLKEPWTLFPFCQRVHRH